MPRNDETFQQQKLKGTWSRKKHSIARGINIHHLRLEKQKVRRSQTRWLRKWFAHKFIEVHWQSG